MACTAEASLADIRELIRFGIAMAAMIRIIATTIRSSMRENPFCLLFIDVPRKPTLYSGPTWPL
jgi:hypothetical protein